MSAFNGKIGIAADFSGIQAAIREMVEFDMQYAADLAKATSETADALKLFGQAVQTTPAAKPDTVTTVDRSLQQSFQDAPPEGWPYWPGCTCSYCMAQREREGEQEMHLRLRSPKRGRPVAESQDDRRSRRRAFTFGAIE